MAISALDLYQLGWLPCVIHSAQCEFDHATKRQLSEVIERITRKYSCTL